MGTSRTTFKVGDGLSGLDRNTWLESVETCLAELESLDYVFFKTRGAEFSESSDRGPKRITLLEVLHAVELKPATGVHRPNRKCPLGAVIDAPLAAVFAEADQAAEQVLDQKTLYDVARTVQRRIAQRARR